MGGQWSKQALKAAKYKSKSGAELSSAPSADLSQVMPFGYLGLPSAWIQFVGLVVHIDTIISTH
jgi:hypothetical protein